MNGKSPKRTQTRPRLMRRARLKTGMSPETLVHTGEQRTEGVRLAAFQYSADSVRELSPRTVAECASLPGGPGVTWLDVDALHDVAVVEGVGKLFGVHPLALEDVLNTTQRPKFEDYGEHLFLVLRMLQWNEQTGEVRGEQVSLALGRNWLVSFQETPGDVFAPVRHRLRSEKGRLRQTGADFLAFSLLDVIVDNYFVVLERIGEQLEQLEDELLAGPTETTLHAIHRLKRELIFIRRAVWPLREAVSALDRRESSLLTPQLQPYLRDLHDHTVQIIDTVETGRDMLSGMLDLYMSTVSNRMNEVMKVLTIIATIFIPLTFLAGVYGMNFKHMPELDWPLAYPVLWGIMLATALGMLYYFRKKKWL
ncbi:MAG: magnesium/cobalt transporter CorA [Deltaproteobacteria bacterium]|nr:magnesium/cobalt transporter CorA [Deltaproteobacteria bacterium]